MTLPSTQGSSAAINTAQVELFHPTLGWVPVCGHYFWTYAAGAKSVCRILGYEDGERMTKPDVVVGAGLGEEKYGYPFTSLYGSVFIGQCRYDDALEQYQVPGVASDLFGDSADGNLRVCK